MKCVALLFVVVSTASAASLLSNAKGKCGPQVQVCTADVLDAAGKPVLECKEAVDGEKVRMSKDESGNGAVVCGPGTFHFSPMQCAGDKFEYKKQSTDVTTSSWSGGTKCWPDAGQKVSFPYTMSCYTVECC